jgi:hypothetical protein
MSNQSNFARLVHWFRLRADSLRTVTTQSFSQTVRTVETVECQERTLFAGNPFGNGSDVCPVCGAKLLHGENDRLRRRLPK